MANGFQFSAGCCCCEPGCQVCNDGINTFDLDLQIVIDGVEPDPANPFYNGTYPCDTVSFPGCDVNPFEDCSTNQSETYPDGLCCDLLNDTYPLPLAGFDTFFTTPDEYGNFRGDYEKIEALDFGVCPSNGGWPCNWFTYIPMGDDGWGAWWAVNFAFYKLWPSGSDPDVDSPILGAGISAVGQYDGGLGANLSWWALEEVGDESLKLACEALSISFSSIELFDDDMYGFCTKPSTVTVERV